MNTRKLANWLRKELPQVRLWVRTERVPGKMIVMVYIANHEQDYPRIACQHRVSREETLANMKIAVENLRLMGKTKQKRCVELIGEGPALPAQPMKPTKKARPKRRKRCVEFSINEQGDCVRATFEISLGGIDDVKSPESDRMSRYGKVTRLTLNQAFRMMGKLRQKYRGF